MQATLVSAALLVCGALSAQEPAQNTGVMEPGTVPVYRVSVTARTAKAINYRHRSGATKIDFRGTDLLPASHGEAKVESKQGYIEVEVEFRNLQPASKFGAEYLTYVLWAITPEGRTSNLGEILINGTSGKLDVTTELQVFGLVVTAEPYFAVTQPSDIVVMENEVRKETIGKVEEIDAKYELLKRGQYEKLTNPLKLKADAKAPLELFEARNAIQIARSMGAAKFAAETFEKAEKSLAQAEAYQARNAGKNPVTMTSREAVQTAEDSRAIAVKRQEEELLATERRNSLDREARADSARTAAQAETGRVTREAETARLQAQADAERLVREKEAQTAAALSAQAETDRISREAEAARLKAQADADRLVNENKEQVAAAQLETDRLKRELDARTAAASINADRIRAEADAREAAAKAEADRLRVENDNRIAAAAAEANRLKLENEAQRAASQAALDTAAKQKAQLEKEKADLRIQLLAQFSAILQTRDTARGLIVNMSDVLFDTAKFTLRPLAREKLAKIAGIVSGHPGLKLDVEGHTDSVGSDDYNQHLSEKRGGAVRDFLVEQGMPAASVTGKGFGETQPVASNDTSAGRQQNRRVEIVISGDIIGTEIQKIIAIR